MSLHVLIADDHTLVSEGLEVMLSMAEDVELAGSVSNGQAVINAAREGDVDVILMDVNLSHSMSGIEATRQVKRIDPSTRVLIMSLLTDPETVSEAIKAGADGYLSKSASREAVIQAIHDVAEGPIYRKLGVRHSGLFSSLMGVDSRSKQDPAELTDREKKVREGMTDGLSTQEIAARLGLPEETVKTNQRSLRQKLGSRYWTEVNPKSILKEFWHRIRKDK